MANILTVDAGPASVVYQSVELARRLAPRAIGSRSPGDPDARELVEHHGLAFTLLEPSR